MRKILGFIFFIIGLFIAHVSHAAIVFLDPATDALEIGEKKSVGVYLDTQGKNINAVDISIAYPPDKLQVVSPSVGNSIVGIWTHQPSYDNQQGVVTLQGGIPGGVISSRALIATLEFRGSSVGVAPVAVTSDSRALLNDGKGTQDIFVAKNATFSLELPPPLGPIVDSATHKDQTQWYGERNPLLAWVEHNQNAEAFSYLLDQNARTIPDNIADGEELSVQYNDVPDGIHYFHIKGFAGGKWGGTTHFTIRIDATPPASFPIQISPARKTNVQSPTASFQTSDALSGISHYEIKLIPLYKTSNKIANATELFTITQSPYLFSELAFGDYDVIVRAYDNAGNMREEKERLSIIGGIFKFTGSDGIMLGGIGTIPWTWVWVIVGILLVGLIAGAIFVDRVYQDHSRKNTRKELPAHMQKHLEELKTYRKKYNKIITLLLFLGGTLLAPSFASAQIISPPQITTISEMISDQDIFYVGGVVKQSSPEVILYLQKKETGEIKEMTIVPQKTGEWFYRHDQFLSSGTYLLWAQSKDGELLSPPSAQKTMEVKNVAFQIGVSRISKEGVFLLGLCVFAVLDLILLIFIFERISRTRKKKKAFQKEIQEAEESIRRGFALLRRDIQRELEALRKNKNSREAEERERELLEDLGRVQKHVTKEIWDVEDVM